MEIMLRIIMVLAACAFAEESIPLADTTSHQDSIPASEVTIIHPPENLTASDYARKARFANPLFAPNKPNASWAPRNQSDYLKRAGYHWLISAGMGLAGFGILYLNDFEANGPMTFLTGVLFIGSFGFQIAVPFDLILAGSAK